MAVKIMLVYLLLKFEIKIFSSSLLILTRIKAIIASAELKSYSKFRRMN